MKYFVLCYNMFCIPRFLKGRHCVELGSLLLWLSIFWTKASVLSESNLTLCVGETFEGHWTVDGGGSVDGEPFILISVLLLPPREKEQSKHCQTFLIMRFSFHLPGPEAQFFSRDTMVQVAL